MADTNTTDVRTISAAEAAEDKVLWEAVARGECEVWDFNFGRDIALEGFMGSRSDDASRLLFDYHGFPVELWTGNTLTVRRVQPAGDDGRDEATEMAYLAVAVDLDNQALKRENATLRAQLAEANARAEKAEQQNAMYKHIADNASDMHYLERENSRLLYRTLAASAPDALLAVRDKLNQAGTERDKVSSEMQRRIQKAVMALLNDDSAEALAALRADSEHDSAAASK